MSERTYSVEESGSTVILHIHRDCALGRAGDEHEFWAPEETGYVLEVGRGSERREVCRALLPHGNVLLCSRDELADTIRREANRALTGSRRVCGVPVA